jgi:hypothetical protein
VWRDKTGKLLQDRKLFQACKQGLLLVASLMIQETLAHKLGLSLVASSTARGFCPVPQHVLMF